MKKAGRPAGSAQFIGSMPCRVSTIGQAFQNIPLHGKRFYFRCTVELGMGDRGWIEMGEMELRSLSTFVEVCPNKDKLATELMLEIGCM